CASHIGFDERLAHQILAGSDILLVPSRFEPCGLTQMYALKYGTVPLARSVGGLEDTIDEFDPRAGSGTGFKFFPFETNIFLQTAQKALSLYKDRKRWRQLMLNGMARDFNWSAAAEKYARLYAALRTG
ncbi:MAG: glycosyltransferase, partial [Nitrospinales bacterium]